MQRLQTIIHSLLRFLSNGYGWYNHRHVNVVPGIAPLSQKVNINVNSN